jgi:hypothetical protein
MPSKRKKSDFEYRIIEVPILGLKGASKEFRDGEFLVRCTPRTLQRITRNVKASRPIKRTTIACLERKLGLK